MDWYSMSAADAVGKLSSSVDRGLSSREAEKRLGQDGENILRGKKKKSIIAEFFEQFKDFTVIVLLIASGVSFATSFLEEHGDFADPIMILIIVILNAAVGVIQQRRAEHPSWAERHRGRRQPWHSHRSWPQRYPRRRRQS